MKAFENALLQSKGRDRFCGIVQFASLAIAGVRDDDKYKYQLPRRLFLLLRLVRVKLLEKSMKSGRKVVRLFRVRLNDTSCENCI